jgi:RNA polymerase sigma-70 factor (ECF subfamily)
VRDVSREVSFDRGGVPGTSSAALATQLVGHEPRPSEVAMRAELKRRLEEVLDSMGPDDREVLALRHFEQLSTAETAQVLGISEATAGKRYIRALMRLKQLLMELPGGPASLGL